MDDDIITSLTKRVAALESGQEDLNVQVNKDFFGSANQIDTGVTGYLKGGMTAWNVGTGYFLGYAAGVFKFALGVATGRRITWDGTTLDIVGIQKVSDFYTNGPNGNHGRSGGVPLQRTAGRGGRLG